MKAVVYYNNGGPDVLEYADVGNRAVGPNEVLIKNEYISIEGGDLIAREIVPPKRVPHVVGHQCAGAAISSQQSPISRPWLCRWARSGWAPDYCRPAERATHRPT
jgi:NADPH:quinone reductase-like Zn-dependent oxidoreductase